MIFSLLRRSELDVKSYDACVEASPWGTIYGLSWWMDIVSPEWECLVWKENHHYKAVLPIPVRRKFGIRFVHQPLFCQFLAVYAAVPLTAAEEQTCIHELLNQYRFIASFSLAYPPVSSIPEGQVTTYYTHVLSLDQSYEDLHRHYNRDRKMNLKRSYKSNWTIRVGTNIETLGEFFRINHEHQIEGGASSVTYELLARLFAETEKRGLSELWYADTEHTPQAGAWFVTWKKRTLYLFNAATATGRKGNARTFLIDQFIQKQIPYGGLFDFESAQEKDIADFYASFGSMAVPYYEIRINRLPGLVKFLWKLKNLVVG